MENNEIIESLKEEIRKRIVSPAYGVYIIAWLVAHWEFAYTAVFVGEEKIWEATKMLKNDYFYDHFLNFNSALEIIWWWGYPIILAYIAIWWIPKFISIPAFKKHLEVKYLKQRLEIEESRKLAQVKVEELEVEEKRVTKEKQIKKEEKEVAQLDPETQWSKDYIKFRKSNLFSEFRIIIESVYDHAGLIKVHGRNMSSGVGFDVPNQILAYSHADGLVDLEASEGRIELTQKGKYFVKRYMTNVEDKFSSALEHGK